MLADEDDYWLTRDTKHETQQPSRLDLVGFNTSSSIFETVDSLTLLGYQ